MPNLITGKCVRVYNCKGHTHLVIHPLSVHLPSVYYVPCHVLGVGEKRWANSLCERNLQVTRGRQMILEGDNAKKKKKKKQQSAQIKRDG